MERQKYVPDLCNVSIITLTSDFGEGSHYTAALKGALTVPGSRRSDRGRFSSVRKFDVIEAAFMLRSITNEFPERAPFMSSVFKEQIPQRLRTAW